MRAAFYEANGTAADVLHVGEVATPMPGSGEVRVKLKTSGINPSDVKGRAGLTRKIAYPRITPHSDGAGVIDEIGDGVPASRVGERVWTFHAQWRRASGTAAEYVTLPSSQAVPLPDNASFEIGAGIGIPAMTAWYAVSLTGDGGTVFIPGGAGAVGFYAIQFAKARGNTVITTVSSPAKADIARKAGADHIINYKADDVAARIAEITGKKGVDGIVEVDLTGNAKLWPSILRPHGSVAVYGTGAEATLPGSFCLTSNINVRFMLIYDLTPGEIASTVVGIGKMLAENRLVHNIARTFPLDQIVAAHQAVESGGVMGKVVLRID